MSDEEDSVGNVTPTGDISDDSSEGEQSVELLTAEIHAAEESTDATAMPGATDQSTFRDSAVTGTPCTHACI